MLNESKSQLVQNVWHKMYTEAAQDLGWIRDWSSKFTSDKWTFYNHFWPFLCQLYENLSQNRDSDGHFKVLNKSESCLVQQLWNKMQIKPKNTKTTNAFFYNITKKQKWKYLHFESYLLNQLRFRPVKDIKMTVWTSVLWNIVT